MNLEALKDGIRHRAAAEIFREMNSEDQGAALLQRIRSQPDTAIDLMARAAGIPESQFHIHRAMVRGEGNVFLDELKAVDGLLHPGDIILMRGTSKNSQLLSKGQKKACYEHARSSHVALVHADFICIDAMPKIGTSSRIASEILQNIEPDWRVIRCKKMQPEQQDLIMRACTFYLAQPYSIKPSRGPAKRFSYCSELARKTYSHSGITGVGIPNTLLVKPADFDRLADGHPQWDDVTEIVRPAIDFCAKYPELVKHSSQLFIAGLKLNRQRFEERTAILVELRQAAAKGVLPRERAQEMIRVIKEAESNMNHTFWDVARKS